MSYLESFHKQQKALKDADRNKKLGAAKTLQSFRSATENQQLEFDKKLKQIKTADRESKKETASILSQYQGTAAVAEAEMLSEKEALHNSMGRLQFHHQNSASSGLNYNPNEDDRLHKSMSEMNYRPQQQESPISPGKKKISPKEEIQNLRRASQTNINKDLLLPPKSPTKTTKTKIEISGRKRHNVELTFLFGLIYDFEALEPDHEDCMLAAASIVPDILQQAMNEKSIPGLAQCQIPKNQKPIVVGAADVDDWFDKPGSERYVIRGKIPVELLLTAGDDSKELSDDEIQQQIVTPLQKLLKRHVSFRPISPQDAQNEKHPELIVGKSGQRQWIRVRESRLGGLGITF